MWRVTQVMVSPPLHREKRSSKIELRRSQRGGGHTDGGAAAAVPSMLGAATDCALEKAMSTARPILPRRILTSEALMQVADGGIIFLHTPVKNQV